MFNAQSRLPGAVWLSEHWLELRAYNFEWVASAGEGVIASSPALEDVIAQVIEQQLADRAVYAFVDFPVLQVG